MDPVTVKVLVKTLTGVNADQPEDSDSVHRPLVLRPHGVRPHRIIKHFSTCNSQLANILHSAAPVPVFPGFMPDLSSPLPVVSLSKKSKNWRRLDVWFRRI
jgi:hypothetical protein